MKLFIGIVAVIAIVAMVVPLLFDKSDSITYVDPAGYVMETDITQGQVNTARTLSNISYTNASSEVMLAREKNDAFATNMALGIVLLIVIVVFIRTK